MTTETKPNLCECREPTYPWDHDLCSACRSRIVVWEDAKDEWTVQIKAAHPTRAATYEAYATAMKMVGHRRSKGELVALVTWLLVRDRLSCVTPSDPVTNTKREET